MYSLNRSTMEVVMQVSESQPVQEPTSKNGSTEKSEKDPNLELVTPQESDAQKNGAHTNTAKSPRCDNIEVKMEITNCIANSSSVETVDRQTPNYNGSTEKGKPPELTSHTESLPRIETQVTQAEKSALKGDNQSLKCESSNLVSSYNRNVTSCGPFMSSIDAVINSVAHNIPPDEPSEHNDSAKSTIINPHAVQNYDHPPHYLNQTNPKQTQVPQANYGDRTVNQPYNPQMFPHLKGQTITSSASYGVPNNPHLGSASEQLSSLVKSHVIDSGGDRIPNDQQPPGHHPGIRPEMHTNIPTGTPIYNHQPMYRPGYDPNSAMPVHPPVDMHQQGPPATHVRPQKEIPSQNTKQPRIPHKGGARRQQRPSQHQQEIPQGMRPRMMPDQFNRGMRPMPVVDPRLMSTYFSPENIRMLQMRYPDPRMMPPQLLQQMQIFARMHQAQQQAQQQQQQQGVRGTHPPSSQPTGVPVTPGFPPHMQGIPPQSQASIITSQQMNVEASQPPTCNSNAVKHPHHLVPPHPGQTYLHASMSQHPHESGKQGLNSQAQEAPVSRGQPIDMNLTFTNGAEIHSQSGIQTALASTSAPHLPSDALNRPSSAGRLSSASRPPSAGRPPSVGRPSSANRPPSVGRPMSAEPPLNRPPSVNRPPSRNSRPPSADSSGQPLSVGRSPSTPQSEAGSTSLGTTASPAGSEPAFSTAGMCNINMRKDFFR